MAPWAAFLSYVNTDDDSIRDALYIDEDTVPPTAIRFTTGDHEMIYYVYDTRDGKIAIWDMNNLQSDDLDVAKACLAQPSFPATEILSIMLRQIYDLTYVPNFSLGWFDTVPYRSRDAKGVVKPSSRNELNAAIAARDQEIQDNNWGVHMRNKHGYNEIRARQRILRDHGWPSAAYDAGKCVAALLAFDEQAGKLRGIMENAVPLEKRLKWTADPAYIEPERIYDEFLTDAAGDLAL